jgi:hypothetical protein
VADCAAPVPTEGEFQSLQQLQGAEVAVLRSGGCPGGVKVKFLATCRCSTAEMSRDVARCSKRPKLQ